MHSPNASDVVMTVLHGPFDDVHVLLGVRGRVVKLASDAVTSFVAILMTAHQLDHVPLVAIAEFRFIYGTWTMADAAEIGRYEEGMTLLGYAVGRFWHGA